MAQFTRKTLAALGINEEQAQVLIDMHQEEMTKVKSERDNALAERDAANAEKGKSAEAMAEVEGLKAKLEALQAKADEASKVQASFDAYRTQIETEKTTAKKKTALDALLKGAGVERDSFRQTLLKGWDIDGIQLDENGGIVDADKLTETVKADFSDFIATRQTNGTPPNTPPKSGNQEPEDDFLKGLFGK